MPKQPNVPSIQVQMDAAESRERDLRVHLLRLAISGGKAGDDHAEVAAKMYRFVTNRTVALN